MTTFIGFNSNPQPSTAFQRDSLLLIIESVGVPDTLLIDLTIKPPSGFKLVNPGLVIGKHLIDSL